MSNHSGQNQPLCSLGISSILTSSGSSLSSSANRLTCFGFWDLDISMSLFNNETKLLLISVSNFNAQCNKLTPSYIDQTTINISLMA